MSKLHCLWCNSELEPPKRKFCSKACDGKYKYHNSKEEAKCIGCGEGFKVSTKKVKFRPQYCSVTCANKNKTNNEPIHDYSKVKMSKNNNAPTSSDLFLKQGTDVKGDVSELYAMIYMSLMGWSVSKSNSHTSRVDYYADLGDSIKRVQVKTSYRRKSSGSFIVSLSKHKDTGYYYTELDFLLVYCPEKSCMLQVPGELVWGRESITFIDPSDSQRVQDNSHNINDFIVMNF